MAWGLLAAMGVLALAARLSVRRLVVPEGHAGLVYRNGAWVRTVGRGRHFLRRPARLVLVDLREAVLTVPGQELLSQDQVPLKVSVAVRYRVVAPEPAMHAVQHYPQALYLDVQLAARTLLAELPVEEALAARGALDARLLEAVQPRARAYGLEVGAVALKDFMFSGELKRTFAEVVRARKEGQAALEKARGEAAALRSLVNAARLMEDVPALLQLRLLQAVGQPQTVVLGVPPGLVPLETKAKRPTEEGSET
jgi:regulator of protease activity HflC (stomatin/prohibitin superfamily)